MSLSSLAETLSRNFESGKYAECCALVPRIKVELAREGLLVPALSHSPRQIVAVRQILEMAILACVRHGDDDQFYKLMLQVRPFYRAKGIERSPNENKLQALYLLHLVAANVIAEFHTELEELIGESDPENDVFLSYPIKLERWLMSGAYDRVRLAVTQHSQFPSPEFAIFAEVLIETVRKEIARCAETAYESLPLANARHMLFFDSDSQIREFIETQTDWQISASGRIVFPTETAASAALMTETVIENSLSYAREIDTII